MRILSDDVPVAAERLGFAGLIPFIVLALVGSARPDLVEPAHRALLLYGAAILSFMGGVQWGFGCAGGDASYPRLGISVLPALLGWIAAFVAGGLGLLLLIAGFGLLLLFDRRTAGEGRVPGWYMTLRRPLTAIVMVSLFVALLRG